MRMAKNKNLNFWKYLEISRIVATSGSRKLRLPLYFSFFCTLYIFLNHVYLPGPFNFYFSQPFTNVYFSGPCTPFWECLDLSGIGGVRLWLTSCGRNEAPGEQPAHSEPFSTVLKVHCNYIRHYHFLSYQKAHTQGYQAYSNQNY